MSRSVDYAIMRILAESSTLAEATPHLLACIGKALSWEIGALWKVDPEAEVLRCAGSWQAAGVEAPGFDELSKSISFAPGVGLPGRVWSSAEAVWIADVTQDENFPRARAAAEAGLRSAQGFPIKGKAELLGVIEFFSRDVREPYPEARAMMAVSGGHIGQFLERMRAEEELRRSEALKTAMLESAFDAVITIDHKGDIVEFNSTAEEMFGFERSEVIGREMATLIIPPQLRDHHRRGLKRYLTGGEGPILNRRIELSAMRADGSEFPVELAITRIGTQEPPKFTGYLRNITERRKDEEALQFLVRASAALDESLDLGETLQTIADLTVPYLADGCMVDLRDADGTIRRAAYAATDPSWEPVLEELQRHRIDPRGRHPIARVMRSGHTEIVPDVSDAFRQVISETDEYYEALTRWPARSVAVVPLKLRGKVLGTMALAFFSVDRTYGIEQISVTEELARRAANSLENARLFTERSRIARTLQQSLLPPHLPPVPGADIAARFQPASGEEEVGGDFYDVFDNGRGGWVVTIGDVSGRGAEAAAITILARHTIRAAAIQESSPLGILMVLNEALRSQMHELRLCTAALGLLTLDGSGATLSLVSAGHPLPLLLRADGHVDAIGRPGTALGVVPEPELRLEVVELSRGDVVVFYTDGVLQSRSGSAKFDVDQLTSIVETCAELNAGATADCIDQAVVDTRHDESHDDAAVLVLRILGTVDAAFPEPDLAVIER